MLKVLKRIFTRKNTRIKKSFHEEYGPNCVRFEVQVRDTYFFGLFWTWETIDRFSPKHYGGVAPAYDKAQEKLEEYEEFFSYAKPKE